MQPIGLVLLILFIAFCVVFFFIAGRILLRVDPSARQVRILGMYSPLATWLKYGRMPAVTWISREEIPNEIRRFFTIRTQIPVPPGKAKARPATKSKKGKASPRKNREPKKQSLPEAVLLRMKGAGNRIRQALKTGPDYPKTLPEKALFLGVTLLGLGLAITPVLLVFLQRWLGKDNLPVSFSDNWICQIESACNVHQPSFFLVLIITSLGLLILLFLQRMDLGVLQTVPAAGPSGDAPSGFIERLGVLLIWLGAAAGVLDAAIRLLRYEIPTWDLLAVMAILAAGWAFKEIPFGRFLGWLRRNLDLLFGLVLAHLALIGVLAAGYSAPQFLIAAWILLAVTVANLARFFRRTPVVFWLVNLALIVFTFNVNSWWTAAAGDEYSFYYKAREIAQQFDLSSFFRYLFNGTGVYGSHPYFSSYLQALTMKLFGTDGFGWRFSSLYLAAISVGLFYLFLRAFLERRIAILAAVLLSVSGYIMSFGKIGYNNLQSLFTLSLALAAAAWAVRSRKPAAYAAVGAAMGLCFYVYPAALLTLPVPVILLALYDPPKTRAAAGRWMVALLTIGLFIFPLLVQPAYWADKRQGTFLAGSDLPLTVSALARHFSANLLYAFYSYLVVFEESHFVAVAYMDPLSGIFVLVGIFYLLRRILRDRFPAFVLLSLGVLLFFVGAFHPNNFPPTTRMFLLLPFWALCAAFGAAWFAGRIARLGAASARWLPAAGLVLVAAIAGINLYQANMLDYQKYGGRQEIETLFLRMARNAVTTDPGVAMNYVTMLDNTWTVDGFLSFQLVYPQVLGQARISQVVLTGPGLSDVVLDELKTPNTVVIIFPRLDPDWAASLTAPLAKIGLAPCAIHTPDGQPRFTIYHDAVWKGLCE